MDIYEKTDNLSKWKLREYVSPGGRKAISDWRANLPTVTRKADFDTFIRNIVKMKSWKNPDLGSLKGRHLKGLYELRWRSDGVPHRIGGYFSADTEFVMLIGWTHNAKKYDPSSALDTIIDRRNKVKLGEATLHDYKI